MPASQCSVSSLQKTDRHLTLRRPWAPESGIAGTSRLSVSEGSMDGSMMDALMPRSSFWGCLTFLSQQYGNNRHSRYLPGRQPACRCWPGPGRRGVGACGSTGCRPCRPVSSAHCSWGQAAAVGDTGLPGSELPAHSRCTVSINRLFTSHSSQTLLSLITTFCTIHTPTLGSFLKAIQLQEFPLLF